MVLPPSEQLCRWMTSVLPEAHPLLRLQPVQEQLCQHCRKTYSQTLT